MFALICCVLTGALYALSLPPYNYEWLAWWFLAPLLISVQRKRPLVAIGMGMLAALTTGIVQVGWHQNTGRLFAAYYPFFLLIPIFSIIAVIASITYKRFHGSLWVLLISCVGLSCEWLTLFMPMPVNLALSQYKQLRLIQIASITGIWGVSFIIWWTNASVTEFILRYLDNRFANRKLNRRVYIPLGISLILWTAVFIFGQYSLIDQSGKIIRVAAIQDYNEDETGDLAPELGKSDNIDRDEMTRSAVYQGAELTVWSEESLGSGFSPTGYSTAIITRHKHKPHIDPTIALVKDLKTSLVVGFSSPGPNNPYNCAALISPDGKVIGIHKKINLYAEERRNLTPGTIATSFKSEFGKVGMEICFDTCNTAITRKIAKTGARLLAVPNYDPPVVRGILHNLHAALVPYRCVENGIPMVRTDSNGNSQIIDKHGRILRQGPLFAPAVLVFDVALGNGQGTFFTRFGDWFAYLCIICLIIQVYLFYFYKSIQKHSS